MDVKWFVIGILVGLGLGLVLVLIMGIMLPDYTSIEDVCFEQTFTPEEYEECLRILKESG